MKEFRKTEDGLFICEECEKLCHGYLGIGIHISKKHNKKEYYDKWLKEEGEGLCKICNKETIFKNFKYKNTCCKEHGESWNHIQIQNAIKEKYGVVSIFCIQYFKENGMLEKYGVKNPSQLPEIQRKKDETNFKKRGVKNPFQSFEIKEKSKQTKKEKYGNENYNNRKKEKQTKLERYGNEKYHNDEKIKQTCLEKYGVEHPMQNKEIYEKQQKSGKQLKYFNNTDLYYRGLYELDFIEKYHEKIDIENGPRIIYFLEGKQHYYFSDFYIKSLNAVVEIKNSYHAKKDNLKIEAKSRATIDKGYNYVIIVDKDYSEFEKLYMNK